MMKGKARRPFKQLAVLVCLTILVVAGCKDLNDNPPPTGETTALINVEELQVQMNANPGLHENEADSSVTITDTAVSSAARTLLVGAFLVTGRGPIASDYEIKESLTTFIGDTLTNSTDFLQLVDLPTSSSFIEFKVPPQSAGKWQVGAIALSTQPKTISDITGTEHKYSAVYSGFSGNLFSADDIGNTAIPVKIKRVCLMSATPPNGCASFGALLTSDPVVTASVEIVGVRVNGSDYSPNIVDFPIIVRTASDVTNAVTKLKTVREEIKDSLTPSSLTVRVTHTENSTESSNCQALANVTNQNEYTNTKLRTHCEVTDHTVYY